VLHVRSWSYNTTQLHVFRLRLGEPEEGFEDVTSITASETKFVSFRLFLSARARENMLSGLHKFPPYQSQRKKQCDEHPDTVRRQEVVPRAKFLSSGLFGLQRVTNGGGDFGRHILSGKMI
jgi:hypothetical protein